MNMELSIVAKGSLLFSVVDVEGIDSKEEGIVDSEREEADNTDIVAIENKVSEMSDNKVENEISGSRCGCDTVWNESDSSPLLSIVCGV